MIKKITDILTANKRIQALQAELELYKSKGGKDMSAVVSEIEAKHSQAIAKLAGDHAKELAKLKSDHEQAILTLEMKGVDDVSMMIDKVEKANQAVNIKATQLISTLGFNMDGIETNVSAEQIEQSNRPNGITIVNHNSRRR